MTERTANVDNVMENVICISNNKKLLKYYEQVNHVH